jgi:hypothetical protein
MLAARPLACARYETTAKTRRDKSTRPQLAAAASAMDTELLELRAKVKAAKAACFAETHERCDAAWELTEQLLVTLAMLHAEHTSGNPSRK